ncbi:hypothetical protein FBU59_003125 [Linderina macrospora]|uniref:Uncharacterized protein n=1 Tax=Linderina macrospora TaxID=4868 RepID=A0ACC1J981_9FUNG|nr:hypothetical protein FBU59_003125 [Linderina macrospora]
MDAGSLTVANVRIDVPFRVFNPDYYPYLYAMYKHLGIGFAAADYSLAFMRNGSALWSYTNLSVKDFQVPIPDSLGCSAEWARLLFLCVRTLRQPEMLHQGSELDNISIGEYLRKQGYSERFVDLEFVPFCASLFTCSLSAAAAYPANTVLHFTARAVFGARLRKAQHGVQEVCEILTRKLSNVRCNASVSSVVPKNGHVLVTVGSETLEFDSVVMATPADTAAKLISNSPAKTALEAVQYEDAVVVTHGDSSVMPSEKASWRGVNIGTAQGQSMAMASHWINYVERTSTGRHLPHATFQTVNPLVPLDESLVLSSTTFHRSLVTVESQAHINDIHRAQGHDNIWMVGTYAAPGVPLLEGCVRSAVDVVRAIGKLPFEAPRQLRKDNNVLYEVGLAKGCVRGELVEAYFEQPLAGSFKLTGVAWMLFHVILPIMLAVSSAIDITTRILLGDHLGRKLQSLLVTVLVGFLVLLELAYKHTSPRAAGP